MGDSETFQGHLATMIFDFFGIVFNIFYLQDSESFYNLTRTVKW
jgi:hypothetical protein